MHLSCERVSADFLVSADGLKKGVRDTSRAIEVNWFHGKHLLHST
jgi:hypothetical protein